MKIVNPSFEIYKNQTNPLLAIEMAGRTCYKSEDKITEDSAAKFVAGLAERGHFAMIEHATAYMQLSDTMYEYVKQCFRDEDTNLNDKYLVITRTKINDKHVCIASGNIRAWYELLLTENNNSNSDAWYIFDRIRTALTEYVPTVFERLPERNRPNRDCTLMVNRNISENDAVRIISEDELCSILQDAPSVLKLHRRITVKFICNRGLSHEFVRQRDASFGQESTRYCCYVKDKFGNEITVINPFYFDNPESTEDYQDWVEACEFAEKKYQRLIRRGRSAQEARGVLPTDLKTELVITATEQEWQHIVNLRAKGTTGAPHPQMKEIMYPCYKELKEYTNGRIA